MSGRRQLISEVSDGPGFAGLQLPASAAAYQAAVKEMFVISYKAYQHVASFDVIPTLSRAETGLLELMGNLYCRCYEHYGLPEQAIDHMANTDFAVSHTSDTVSGFIRYELSGERYPILAEKAQDLADQMNQSMPNGYVDYGPPTHYRHCWLEPVVTFVPQSLLWNGIVSAPAQGIDPKTTWIACSGSYFEYLAKYARLTNTDDSSYVDAWLTAADTSIKTLLRTSTVGGWLFLVNYDDNKNIVHVSHLACLSRGNWIPGTPLFRVN
ncbi:hypothetical protein M405DRAFT_841726 [Rhizopogon salebrosus TDB-379]|nr:hypothetical protein M405DRAFT_841726 [Rhizopogon salebrosus TDB-379]